MDTWRLLKVFNKGRLVLHILLSESSYSSFKRLPRNAFVLTRAVVFKRYRNITESGVPGVLRRYLLKDPRALLLIYQTAYITPCKTAFNNTHVYNSEAYLKGAPHTAAWVVCPTMPSWNFVFRNSLEMGM